MREAAAWTGLALVALAFALTRGVNRADEGWFLRVVQRLAAGEVLYRDVFFGATPLSAWIGAGLAALPGPELVWLKALTVGGFVALAACCDHLTRRLGGGPEARLMVGGALLAFALPAAVGVAPYTLIANVGALGCCALALRVLEEGEDRLGFVAAAGGAAALAFAAKQNVGAATLFALLATLALAGPAAGRGRGSLVGAALCGFALIGALVAAPVLLSGGGAALLDYGFLGKGRYLSAGALAPESELARLFDGSLADPDRIKAVYLSIPALLPAAAVAAALLRFARDRADDVERRRGITVLAFLTAGLLALVPRASFTQIALYAPICLPALAWGGRALLPRPGARRAVVTLTAILVAAGVGYVVLDPVARVLGSGYAPGGGELRGVWLKAGEETALRESAAELSSAAAGRPLLIVSGEAGFWGALARVPNPTPFDYPFVTAFGASGELDVAAAVASGAVPVVCVDGRIPAGMRPERLLAAIAAHMTPERDLGPCVLHRRPDPAQPPGV